MTKWEALTKWVNERARGLLWLCVGVLLSGAAIGAASFVVWVRPTESNTTDLSNKLAFAVLRVLPPKSAEKKEPDQSCLDCEVKLVELHYMMPEEGNDARVKFTFVQKTKSQNGKFQLHLGSLKYDHCSREEDDPNEHNPNGAELKAKTEDPDRLDLARVDAATRTSKQPPKAPTAMPTILVDIKPPPEKSKLPYHVSVICDIHANPHKFTYTKFVMDFSFEDPARQKGEGLEDQDKGKTKPRARASTEVSAQKVDSIVSPSAPALSVVNETQPPSGPSEIDRGALPTSGAKTNPEPTEIIQDILFKADKDRFADEPYFEGGMPGDDAWSRHVSAGQKITMHWSDSWKTELKEIAIILVGIFGAAAIAAYVEAARPYIDKFGRRRPRHADLT